VARLLRGQALRSRPVEERPSLGLERPSPRVLLVRAPLPPLAPVRARRR